MKTQVEPKCPCCGQGVAETEVLVDPITRRFMRGNKIVEFTPQGFSLAQVLLRAYPGMVTKEEIYDRVFMKANGEGPHIKIVDVQICKIRPLMAEVGMIIETAWGKGYRIVQGDVEQGESIKEASIRLRGHGMTNRWTPALDTELKKLMRRKYNVTQCATLMRMPYMTVERAFRRLSFVVKP